MTPRVSVVIPVYNGARFLADCLIALRGQSLPAADFETIVVDDGSTDATAEVARGLGFRVEQQAHSGAPAARNRGARAAGGEWVAFTDADCLPSRQWLQALLEAVADSSPQAMGAAGRMVGYQSDTPAARFVDLSGGLDAQDYLDHPRFPFAPTGNVVFRRTALLAAGGFDERFTAYDSCDLHTRLRQIDDAPFHFAPRAVVLHRHRRTWPEYWRQQLWYGRGYGQFLIRHREAIGWSVSHELRAWGKLGGLALAACRPGGDDGTLVRRGQLVKMLAQRLGCMSTYWSPRERARW